MAKATRTAKAEPKQEIKQPIITQAEPPQPKKVEPAIVKTEARAIPNTRPLPQAAGNAILYNKKNGTRLPMSRASAERWARKHPQDFQVI